MIYPACKVQIALLMAEKVTILTEYLDYLDVFSKKSATELPKCSNINKYVIDLEPSKSPPYSPTWSLELMKPKTVKIYIMTNMANSFIWLSKSPVGAFILFIQKSHNCLRLCEDY